MRDIKYPFYVLGLDPSLNGTGFCVLKVFKSKIEVVDRGTIDVSFVPSSEQARKLNIISGTLKKVVNTYQPLFPKVFSEYGFVKGNEGTKRIFEARGVMKAELVGYEIIEYSPNTVKSQVAGHGHSSKEAVEKAVAKLTKITSFSSDNESDAIAVALLGVHTEIRNLW